VIYFAQFEMRPCFTAGNKVSRLAVQGVQNDLLVIADIGGLVHCLDAKTGKVNYFFFGRVCAW
jgi:hypothetical protein